MPPGRVGHRGSGVWEADVTTHPAALLRSNELLLRGLDLGPHSHILDVGFGSGGFSTWAARTTGARVTGITVVGEHVALAGALARASGVADRCRFLTMDMDALAFEESAFDVVVNQETFCHAADKAGYLVAVSRVLRPGGWWRAVDFSVRQAPLADDDHRYRGVCDGFHVPSLASLEQAAAWLDAAGFTDIVATDLTPLVLKTASRIRSQCYLPLAAYRLGIDRLFRPATPTERGNRIGHVTAAYQYSRGLHHGLFRHAFYSARTPGQH